MCRASSSPEFQSMAGGVTGKSVYGALAGVIGAACMTPVRASRVNRPPWRKRLGEYAHELFGFVTALVSEETSRQASHRPSSDMRRLLARSG